MYGNLTLGDCTWAAAADWEIAALGIEPSEVEVIASYEARHKEAPFSDVWPVWETQGIDGVQMTYRPYLLNTGETTQPALEALVRKAPVIAAVTPSRESYLTHTDPVHAILVDGFSPIGPVIVTWAHAHQMSWAEWEAESLIIYTPVPAG